MYHLLLHHGTQLLVLAIAGVALAVLILMSALHVFANTDRKIELMTGHQRVKQL